MFRLVAATTRRAAASTLRAVTSMGPRTAVSALTSASTASTSWLGAATALPRRGLSSVLPAAEPSGSDSDDVPAVVHQPIDSFDLSDKVKSALKSAGFQVLFPVQADTLPSALQGKDLIVRAKTGTGKTLGYERPPARWCFDGFRCTPRRGRLSMM